jgi:membrane associated rhomboid family serine protease
MNRYRRFDIKSIVVTLIIVNVIVFFISQINMFPLPERFLNTLVSKGKSHVAFALQRYGLFLSLFSLFPVMIRDMGWLWQFFSYMFLHGNFLHLFFNMYVLLLFGRPLEQRWGWKEFFVFYCATGVGAGVFTYFWNIFTSPLIPTIGASGAIFAVVPHSCQGQVCRVHFWRDRAGDDTDRIDARYRAFDSSRRALFRIPLLCAENPHKVRI